MEWLARKIRNLVGRCVLEAITVNTDGTVTAKNTILDGDTNPDDELMQQYGFASVPFAGAEGFSVFVDGSRSHGIIIATEDGRYRLKNMQHGEVALYTDEGDRVYLKRGREIEVVTKTLTATVESSAKIDCPNVEATGNVSVGGNLDVTGNITGAQVGDSVGSLAELRLQHETHVHNVTMAAPGTIVPTTPPVVSP